MSMIKLPCIFFICLMSISSLSVFSQHSPMVYQFVVRDGSGHIVGEETLDVDIAIIEGSLESGDVIYAENHRVTTSEKGLVRLSIGTGEREENFNDIIWDVSKSYFIRAVIENLPEEQHRFQHTTELLKLVPQLFAGGLTDFSDHYMDSMGMGVKALSIKDNKLYLSNGGVIELPAFLKHVNSLLIKADKRDVSCHGEEDGSIDLSVEGGFPPYSYEWSNGSISQDLYQLEAGRYKVYVTDSKGYTAIKEITVNQPDPLELNAQVSNVGHIGAEDGSIDLQVKGGRPPYMYEWSNGATSASINGLAPGIYRVTVRTSYQCSKTRQFVVKEPVDLSFDREHVQCYGEKNGSVDLKIRGGKPPYKIRWSVDQSGTSLTGLSAGKYYVSVVDGWDYQVIDSISILQPYPLQIRDSVTHILNEDSYGQIHLKVKGGIPPYQYQWSTGDTTSHLSDLKNGVYSVTVKDANGCIKRSNNIFVYRIIKDPRDSQRYKVITIGDQTWMAENLNIGKSIESDALSTPNGQIEKYCYDNSEEHCNRMGGLYTWEEAIQYRRPANKPNEDVQGVCPDGWHIPSEKEWQRLSDYLGGEMVAGNKLKDPGYWERTGSQDQNRIYLNVTGFAALPAGRMDLTGASYYKGVSTSFWSASQPNSEKAWHRTITTRGSGLYRDASYTAQKYSVRCIKDP